MLDELTLDGLDDELLDADDVDELDALDGELELLGLDVDELLTELMLLVELDDKLLVEDWLDWLDVLDEDALDVLDELSEEIELVELVDSSSPPPLNVCTAMLRRRNILHGSEVNSLASTGVSPRSQIQAPPISPPQRKLPPPK